MGIIYELLSGGKSQRDANEEYSQAVKDAEQAFSDNYNAAYASGLRGDDLKSVIDTSSQNITDAKNELEKARKKNSYNIAGNGLIGAIINPLAQTASAGEDIVKGVTSGNWDEWNKRDRVSDLGALAETALTVIPGAGAAAKAGLTGAKTAAKGLVSGAGKTALKSGSQAASKSIANSAAKAASKSTLSKVARDTALGAGFGAAGAVREGGENTNLSDVLSNAATGAAIGGGLSAGLRGGSKLWNKYSTGPNTAGNLSGKLSNVKYNLTNGGKNGVVRSLLSKTPTKVALGGGGALLLSNLLNGGGNTASTANTEQSLTNSTQTTDNTYSNSYGLTDDELAELYNYYYGGGY